MSGIVSKLLNGWRVCITFALVAPEVSATAPVASLTDRIRQLLADPRFTWRKIATLASKTGATVADVLAVIPSLPGKIDRTGKLAKLVSIEAAAPATITVQTDHDDYDDDADDDYYNEYDVESELDEDSENDDLSDGGEIADHSFDTGKVTVLREKLNSPNYRWRKLGTLAQSAGLSESVCRNYLNYIGARESHRGGLFRN